MTALRAFAVLVFVLLGASPAAAADAWTPDSNAVLDTMPEAVGAKMGMPVISKDRFLTVRQGEAPPADQFHTDFKLQP